MDTPTTDPLDAVWPSERRAAAREACRARAIEAADATIAKVPPQHLEAFGPEAYREEVVADWLRVHEAYLDRARAIITAPEAAGHEDLARHLINSTDHGVLAAILILRGAGADVAALPVGGARKERLAAIRRAATLEASA